ncbi:endocuticle structural glycoprotein SgAbd-2-like [Diprion similis]|uniref:endocuticle structural glycoprotein SgAbd-2-like n=1 Tax=Diprion similis TaxID=362088 RepID=UPI001EF8407D|nr:endocuticle structural glycoprotein SgAbd-2-like [Diprion similis]
MSTRRGTKPAMNTLILTFFALAAAAAAAPLDQQPPVPIVNQYLDGPNPDGTYSYGFEAGNGIKLQEQGQLENAGTPDEAESVQGSYSYPSEDGNLITLTYVAGKDGFQAQGAHLPQAPPIPDAILKALEWIAAHPEEDNL